VLALPIDLNVTVMPIAWTLPAAGTFAATWVAGAAAVAMGIGLVQLVSARPRLAQTTLHAAWWWCLAAFTSWWAAVLANVLVLTGGSTLAYQPLRVAGMLLSVTPIVAVLGAKRPQDKMWNFVVLTLWGILALPAAETMLLHRGQRVDLGVFRGSLLWILILLGPINYVPTRYWLASLLFAAGQIIALCPFLPLIRRSLLVQTELVGFSLAAAAIVAAWLVSLGRTPSRHPLDRLWLNFRDTYGLFWSLRVQERLNASAKQHAWNVELRWTGFRAPGSKNCAVQAEFDANPQLRTTFKSLLRRFVSKSWIAARSG
jgi:hypothetical protein